jgi:hypothetical protein
MSSDEFDVKAALADENTPAGLRKWAESQATANKKLADELAEFKTAARSNTLTSALKDAGVSEKLARFYPANADVSGEAIAGWLKDNGDVFGVAVKPTDVASSGGAATNVQVADIAAMQAVQGATPTNQSTPTLQDRVAEIDGLTMRKPEDRAALDAFERQLMEYARLDQSNQYLTQR